MDIYPIVQHNVIVRKKTTQAGFEPKTLHDFIH